MSSLEQQQKRPSLHLTADVGAAAGTGTGTGIAAAETIMSPATTPLGGSGAGFLPDMPQWKKDLIQRRKTNVARTNAAASSPTSTADGNISSSSCMAFTEPADSGATDATVTATTITSQQQQLLKRNVSQTTTTLKTCTTAEEKSEKCFIGAGGHHTIPASSASAQSTQQQQQSKDFTTVFSTETSTAASAAAPIPKQRSSLFNTRSQSTGKELEILNLDTRERERTEFGERDVEVNSIMLNSSHNRKCSRASGEVETGTATTGALTALGSNSNNNNSSTESGSGANVKQTATSSSSANQLQTKCKLGQIVGAEAATSATTTINSTPINFSNITTITTAAATTTIDNKSCKSKISDKLQSNKFIQNQQQQKQQLERQTAASPTKVAVKTTMVAMQEMKKTTTQNGQQRHHVHLNHHHHNVKQNAETTDVDDVGVAALHTDNSEDLSYGPGIVSKLRCRYLSLALRCETRQQSQQQRLQRSTSLNTLLDRNDEEDDEELNNVDTTPTAVAAVTAGVVGGVGVAVSSNAAQQRSTSGSAAPPPILGVKPTAVASGYIKSVSVVQQQQQLRLKQTQQDQQQSQQPQQNLQSQQATVNGTRSRHFKRGNEVMKRARSVEALLCEKSPWNTQRASYQAGATASTNSTSSAASATAASVTIEDKIHNARERLHSGTDAAPPKRLTSIIDDTERPPPDLVKQTLKMFEASANRRPRATQRSNGVGGVASKVASYKSIIAEQKPANSKVVGGAGGGGVTTGLTVQGTALAASTPLSKQRAPPSFGNAVPDIIPRQLETFESPVSTLSKMLGRMQLDTPTTAAQTEVGGAAVGAAVGGGGGAERLVSDKRSQAASNEVDDVENDNDEDSNEVNDNDVDIANDDDNNDEGGDSGDDVCNGDKMGAAAGDKLTHAALPVDEATPTAAVAAGGNVQRSFAAALQENAHVVSSINNKIKKPNNDTVLTTTTTSSSATTTTKQIGVIRPLLNQAAGSGSGTPLTSREIEKNRINEMKKSTALAADAALAAAAAAESSSITSLDTVINTHTTTNKDASETDAGASSAIGGGGSGISPIWPHLRKRRQPTTTGGNASIGGNAIGNADNNTSMVFNFSKSTKEVPDYIESDVVIYRRKRELPKPNEPGFVLLGDLSVETSTDTDYDDYSMCPPSPCDVEFENANIVIDGKSSIRQKTKDSSFRVQFNDTLTSTFEYPSEASQTIDDPPYADPYGNVNKHHQLLYEEQLILQHHQQQQQQQQQQHHHHVTVDEIIELPTSTTSSSTSASGATSHKTSATSAMLGNLPLDYPSLGKSIMLQQAQQLPHQQLQLQQKRQQQQQQQQQQHHHQQIKEDAGSTNLQRRRKASVLLKPQYACFLQNDAVPQSMLPKQQQLPRKAASFCFSSSSLPQSKYQTTTATTAITSTSTTTTTTRAKWSNSSSYSASNSNNSLSLRRASLPIASIVLSPSSSSSYSSLSLPNASTALLQARIPGNTLYYV